MKFIKSATKASELIYDNLSEVCFIGRSNVGKSSLINALSNSKISRVSNTPGRTQLINYFEDKNFRLVDLPGYGYANVSKQKRKELIHIVEEYLFNSTSLKAIFQIVDGNVITNLDQEMSNYFQDNFSNHIIIMNKIDKQNISRYVNNLEKTAQFLNVDKENIIMISARNRININLVLSKIKSIVQS